MTLRQRHSRGEWETRTRTRMMVNNIDSSLQQDLESHEEELFGKLLSAQIERTELVRMLDEARNQRFTHRYYYFNRFRVRYNEAVTYPEDKLDNTDLAEALSRARNIDSSLSVRIRVLKRKLEDVDLECFRLEDQMESQK
ncbi:Hypothetical predicted protein [Cloeon dipterum]|uniref:Uncharacterized protein n=1 Tax=Cloeon dipterum TaxID=197152 RepID=A0A8S1C2C9_9INSE|nr:Hypothetical predicted protein [Cloeon dipterum]